MKELKDLNLLDRFLFAEVMENPENMRTLLEIILGKEIVLKHLPQTEKEERTSPLYRFAKLDVWAADEENTVYDTEVQGRDTGNLPHRSRYYEGVIDGKMLKPGEADFAAMGDVYIIIIAPFDIFGKDRYCYTFQMACREEPGVWLNDGATRIFLNTHGKNPELVELLHYIESTNQTTADFCKSPQIHELQKRIQAIKSNEEMGIKYMQRWEELVLERQDGREEGLREGRESGLCEGRESGLREGQKNALKALIKKKLARGKTMEEIAEDLEEELPRVMELAEEVRTEEKTGEVESSNPMRKWG